VEVHVVGSLRGGDDRVLLVLFPERVELIGDGLVGYGLLLDPADGAVGSFHLDGTAAAFEDLELLSVSDLADAVGDGSEAVAQDALLGDDVDVLGLAVGTKAAATS